jgi:zinc transporter, ZIP family
MLEAGAWGLFGASSLLAGALIGTRRRAIPTRALGLILGFGAGTLFSAVAFELTEDAYKLGGADAVALGLAFGALAYFAGDQAIGRRGGENRMSPHRRRRERPPQADSASALLLGAVLDGIPESAVIGISLLGGQQVSVAVLAAVFLSNLPEALGSSAGMHKEGIATRHIVLIWLLVVLASGAAAALGYGLLKGASDNTVALIEAFAGGAVLTMLADEMIPQARADGGLPVGLATVLGFALVYLLSTLE